MTIMTKKEENFTATDFSVYTIQTHTLQHILAGIISGRTKDMLSLETSAHPGWARLLKEEEFGSLFQNLQYVLF